MQILAVAFFLLFVTSGVAYPQGFLVKTNDKDYQVNVTLANFPLVLGANRLEIAISDGSGKSIRDAEVLVNYYMPPMPRMVPMNYKTKASLASDTYEAKMHIIMAGPWYIRIIISRAGKVCTARFNVDAQ